MPDEQRDPASLDDASLDIVVLGGFPWGDASNHTAVQTVRALANENRVLYISDDPQGSTLRHLIPRGGGSSAWSAPSRTALSKGFTRMRAEQVTDRLWVAPLRGLTRLLPLSYPEPVRTRSAARISDFIRRETAHIGMHDPVLWFYWWFFPELTELPHSVTVYDNIDDHAAYDSYRRWAFLRKTARALERRLLQNVDLAYALSPELATEMRSAHPRMSFQPPGIDLTSVTRALAELERPRDVANLPRPLIGYAGSINDRIDWRVIGAVARSRAEWTFVFVGGQQPAGFAPPPNVHFLPGRAYPEMMRAVREFDVGVIPWIDSPATRGAYSYKALDYLAAGKQVVATTLPFSVDLAGRHPEVITTVSSADEWDGAITGALRRASRELTTHACVSAAQSRTTQIRTEAIVADIRANME